MSEPLGSIAATYVIDLRRPRSLDVMATPAFAQYEKAIRADFQAIRSLDDH